ncbi:MAG: carbohydrate ABC transporter substrate-binding protein [Clostridia bacterium]|nr:carbohydrate ABC transporter substrate-binding protein [Clostridia bacterium]
MKKLLSAALILAMLCTVFAGMALAEENVTLRFRWWGGDERNEATIKVIEQFEELNPGVTIEYEPGSADGYHDKLATELAGGTAPDIVQIDPETFPTYVANGDYFFNLDDFEIDMSAFEEGYIHQQINGYYDGRQLGLPTGIAGPAIVVNKALAEQLGVDLHIDNMQWDDIIELGKAVRAAGDDDTYLFCANKDYVAILFVMSYAKQLTDGVVFPDGKLALTEEQLTEIYEFVKALFDNECVPSIEYMAAYTGDNIQSDANWLAGKYVAALAYISTVDVMVANGPEGAEYYAGSLPVKEGATDGGWASNTPQVLAITKTCEHPEIAAAFLNYFFTNETAMETLGATRSVPPTAKAREICAANGKLTQLVTDAADIAVAISGTPNDKIFSTAECKNILYDAVEAIAYGDMTPAEAAADTIAQLKELEQ